MNVGRLSPAWISCSSTSSTTISIRPMPFPLGECTARRSLIAVPSYSPAAVLELADFDARIADRHRIHDQRPVGQQTHQRYADAHLACRKRSCLRAGPDQFRAIELELRSGQPPASVHTGELDLHADRLGCPGLDFFLILGELRQEQAEQPDKRPPAGSRSPQPYRRRP